MPEQIQVDVFLAQARELPVIDARAPSEFSLGHIPGAVNVPLFSDEERAEIGTTYKKVGRREAIMIGMRHIGSRLGEFADQLLAHAEPAGNRARTSQTRAPLAQRARPTRLERASYRKPPAPSGQRRPLKTRVSPVSSAVWVQVSPSPF